MLMSSSLSDETHKFSRNIVSATCYGEAAGVTSDLRGE